MATYEKNALLTFRDAEGNKYLVYPITKLECVDGVDELLETISGKASTSSYSAVLNSSGWSSSAPYTQTVTVNGLLVSDNPFVDIDMSGASGTDTGASLLESWNLVGRIVANDNSITAYCYEEKPTVNISVILKVVR